MGFAAARTEEWKIPFQPVRQDFHGKKLYLLNRSCKAADGSIPSDTPANHPVGWRVFKAHPVPEQFALRMAAGDVSTLPGGTPVGPTPRPWVPRSITHSASHARSPKSFGTVGRGWQRKNNCELFKKYTASIFQMLQLRAHPFNCLFRLFTFF